MIDAKEYGVRKLDAAMLHLTLEQMILRASEQELWEDMDRGIWILRDAKKRLLAEFE